MLCNSKNQISDRSAVTERVKVLKTICFMRFPVIWCYRITGVHDGKGHLYFQFTARMTCCIQVH